MTADDAPQGVPFLQIDSATDLADEAVVELLVRGFCDFALETFHAVADDKRSLDDGTNDIGDAAQRLNDVFLGLERSTNAVLHPWNAPDQLGVYLREAMGLDFPPDECVRAGLIHLATLMMHAVQGAPDGWEGEVEALRLDMRDLLLGRQALDGDEGDELPM